jgi:hypothetical protein
MKKISKIVCSILIVIVIFLCHWLSGITGVEGLVAKFGMFGWIILFVWYFVFIYAGILIFDKIFKK